MLSQLIAYCTSYQGQLWITLWSDLAIALAYFAIPLTMLVVLRDRRHDIPYPWLWTLFVTFIVACGLTHVVHLWSAFMGVDYAGTQATISVITALASVGTAIAFTIILPQIKTLPSPWQQKRDLEKLVDERTREKDRLIREINHRIGNQLQILSSIVSIEMRRAKSDEAHDVLQRFRKELVTMGEQHTRLSQKDYLGAHDEEAGDAPRHAEERQAAR